MSLQINQDILMAKNRGKLFVISAPSGAGKTSLTQAVLPMIKPHHPLIERVITYTTKQQRITEKNGYDYHFIEKHDFERLIQEGFFLEWSDAYGTYYGSPTAIVEGLAIGRSYIMILDRNGAQSIARIISDAILIYIGVPSVAILKDRLLKRQTETLEQIERRLERARIEILDELQQPLFHHYIVNDHFEQAAEQLHNIFLRYLQPTQENYDMKEDAYRNHIKIREI